MDKASKELITQKSRGEKVPTGENEIVASPHLPILNVVFCVSRKCRDIVETFVVLSSL